MHDDLGAGLSGLKLRTELAARVEQDPGKRAQLGQLATLAGELIGNMRRLIWTMDGGQGTVDDLVAYCANYARQYLSEHGIACVVEVPGAWPALQVRSEQRRNVFLLIKEALHNVVKHAGARQVTLHFALAEGDLLVEVSDDGVGLNGSADAPAPGLGLRSMRQRMESIGGRFSAGKVAHGPGTRITGRIPLVGE
jgi:signal transduction histidine kinase